VTVMTLRKKLGEPPLIETVVGAGYRMAAPPPSARQSLLLARQRLLLARQ